MNNSIEPNIYKLIESENFRKRTAMFIGEKKISVLRGFINGYDYALHINNINDENLYPNLNGFHDWVAEYYGLRESTAGWNNMILTHCAGDEDKAVDEFFKLYDLFTGREEIK